MIYFPALLLVFLLLFFAIMHFHWASGGRWALDHIMPENQYGKKAFTPSIISSALIGIFALGMIVFICIFVLYPGMLFSEKAGSRGLYAIAFIFLVRAITDVRHFSFSRRQDSYSDNNGKGIYYSLLCLSITIFAVLTDLL